MLKLTVTLSESFDEDAERFITDDVTLELEHSLVSLAAWESKWEKPFLGDTQKTTEEALSYIECMILTPDFPPEVISKLSPANIDAVDDYINRKMTATWFAERNDKPSTEIITAELIYYWLVAMEIPWEAQYWHLSRLMTLIRVVNEKNNPPKPLTGEALRDHNRRLNKARQEKYKTKG